MFVVLISFPPTRAGKDAEFRDWFAKSNEVLSSQGLYKEEATEAGGKAITRLSLSLKIKMRSTQCMAVPTMT